MTDPKNIPLAEARPGDMVFLKPLAFDGHSTHGVYVAKPDGQSMGVGLDWIDHIERAPRALKVGDRVWRKTTHHRATVLAIDGDIAWVKGENDHRWTAPLTDLEPIE